MLDILGYDRTARSSGEIASSEFAAITIGTRQSLVQNVNVSYQQQIETVLEVGDTNVYWVPGRAQGNIQMSKLVGAGGFFNGLRDTDCGRIDPISVNVAGGRCGYVGQGQLRFDGGIIESFGMSMSAAQLQIMQTTNIRVASMSAV